VIKRIIGIDPGISNVGWAVIEPNKQGIIIGIASGTIKTNSSSLFQERIHEIISQIDVVTKEYRPSIFGLEEVFINKNPQNSIKLVQARGAIIAICSINSLIMREFSATKIKKTLTGVGNADKNQIEYMVKLLIKNSSPKSNHESDAYAIAYTSFVMSNNMNQKLIPQIQPRIRRICNSLYVFRYV